MGRPVALAAASARSSSAISGSVNVTIHERSAARRSPRQALGPVIGFMQIELIDGPPRMIMTSPHPRVESIPQAVAHDVQRHHYREDHQAGIERDPRGLREIALGGV